MNSHRPSELASAITALVASMQQLSHDMHEAAQVDFTNVVEPDASHSDGHRDRMPRLHVLAKASSQRAGVPLLGLGFLGARRPDSQVPIYWWFVRPDGMTEEQLVVNTQPRALTFYDAAQADWWRGAVAGRDVYASGPYIDVSGTNAYIVTFSKSVHMSGALAGVVAADIRVGDLQALLREQLVSEPRAVSLIDHEGAVIATNRGRLLGGTVDPDGVTEYENIAGTNWRIVR